MLFRTTTTTAALFLALLAAVTGAGAQSLRVVNTEAAKKSDPAAVQALTVRLSRGGVRWCGVVCVRLGAGGETRSPPPLSIRPNQSPLQNRTHTSIGLSPAAGK
jgi:hypothetical protein